jgi:hypothetical protein
MTYADNCPGYSQQHSDDPYEVDSFFAAHIAIPVVKQQLKYTYNF